MTQIKIPVEKLPAPDKNGDHAFQFRIISVDKNQWSAWSQLYVIKSIGQYRPLESEDITVVIGTDNISVTWDTPTIYNYNSASITSASIQTTGSQGSKQRNSDIFIQWDSGDFEYHDRVSSDTTSIIIPTGATSFRVVGTVALKDVPEKGILESSIDYQARLIEYLGISGSVQGVYDLFKIFDTGVVSLTWYN